MKTDVTTKILLAALAGALWVIALRPMVQPQPAHAQTAPVRWEYRFARVRDLEKKEINELGDSGWEAVAMVEAWALMKRPK